LIVPGVAEVHAAPGGIAHYVADHGYLPPAGFIAAAMACPDCGSANYFEMLRAANCGTRYRWSRSRVSSDVTEPANPRPEADHKRIMKGGRQRI
jgi:hypothetical protein